MCSSLSLEVNDNLSVINMMLIEFKLIERSLTFPCYTLPKVGGCLFSCETYLFVSWRLLVNLSRVDMKNGLPYLFDYNPGAILISDLVQTRAVLIKPHLAQYIMI
jgi:hypothetical protein